jgi:DNA-directed RNA polymerase subunit L
MSNFIGEKKNYYFIVPDEKAETNIKIVKEKISFTWENVNVAFVNTFRRLLLSEIPTKVLGDFKFFDYKNMVSNCQHLEMAKLQPVMHNEQLALAIEHIPISQDDEKFGNVLIQLGNEREPYLVPEQNSLQVEEIYTDKLKVFRITENERLEEISAQEYNEFFPRRVLITKLKRNQKLGFQCKKIMGLGKDNSKFTPVCSVGYMTFEPKEKTQGGTTLYKETYEYNPNEVDFIPNKFLFHIHSLPYWSPEQVLHRGFIAFKQMINRNLIKWESMRDSIQYIDGDDMTDGSGNTKTIVFTFENENYTIGTILQFYVSEVVGKTGFSGVMIEHPKKKFIKFRVSSEDPKLSVNQAFYNIISDVEKFHEIFIAENLAKE